jgi:hypothetical protein
MKEKVIPIRDTFPQYFEPILISIGNEKWEHPEINDIVESLKDSDYEGMCGGPFYKFWLYQEEKLIGHVVCAMDNDFYRTVYDWNTPLESKQDGWNQEAVDTMYGMLWVSLVEDFWSPAGEQFCFSEFGKKIPVDVEVRGCSPDVVVHEETDGWEWSS